MKFNLRFGFSLAMIVLVAIALSQFLQPQSASAQTPRPTWVGEYWLNGASALTVDGLNVFVAGVDSDGAFVDQVSLIDPTQPLLLGRSQAVPASAAAFKSLFLKRGDLFAANDTGLWYHTFVGNGSFRLLAELEGAHAMTDLGGNLFAVVGKSRMIVYNQAQGQVVADLASPDELTAVAGIEPNRMLIARGYAGGSVSAFRFISSREGIENQGGPNGIGRINALVHLGGGQVWAAREDRLLVLDTTSTTPGMDAEIQIAGVQYMSKSGPLVTLTMPNTGIMVVNAGKEGERSVSALDVAALPVHGFDQALLVGDLLVAIGKENGLMVYRLAQADPKETATPVLRYQGYMPLVSNAVRECTDRPSDPCGPPIQDTPPAADS